MQRHSLTNSNIIVLTEKKKQQGRRLLCYCLHRLLIKENTLVLLRRRESKKIDASIKLKSLIYFVHLWRKFPSSSFLFTLQELTKKLDSNTTATDIKFAVLESKIEVQPFYW